MHRTGFILLELLFLLCCSNNLLIMVESFEENINRQICNDSYGLIQYIPEDKMFEHKPPLLLSFPGSGNTWIRLLIEYCTGYFTGSLYNDNELNIVLAGEKSCGIRTSAIKSHPNELRIIPEKLENGIIEDRLKPLNKKERKKCNRGMVHHWEKIIMLVRDPFLSIFADTQRLISGHHSGSISYKVYNNHSYVQRRFHEIALISAKDYNDSWYNIILPSINSYKPENIYTLKYELMLHNSTKYTEIKNLLQFMEYNYTSFERIECSFILSQLDYIYRPKKLNPILVYQNIEKAYPGFICQIWNLVKSYSQYYKYNIIIDNFYCN